jgi:hypothetical protein
MTIDPAGAGSSGLVDRVKNIITAPAAEWDRIAPEPADVNKLYLGYALPLVTIAAIAGFIGTSLIGTSLLGITYRLPIVTGVVSAVLQVVAALACLYIMGIVTNALAPNFGSTQNQGNAHKFVVYGATAAFLGGIFAIFPPIAILALLAAIYTLYIAWIGLPKMMNTPEDKRVGYFAVIIIIWIVVAVVINVVLGSILAMTGGLNMPVQGLN